MIKCACGFRNSTGHISGAEMKIHKMIISVCGIAEEDIGREKAVLIAETAQKFYETLCSENDSDPKALRDHTYKRIYPAVALYKTFRAEGIASEKAVCISVNIFSGPLRCMCRICSG